MTVLVAAGAAVALWPSDTPSVATASADAGIVADAAGADSAAGLATIADAAVPAAPIDASPTIDARPRDGNRVVRPRRADAAPPPRAVDAGTRVVARADAAVAPPKKASFTLKADTWCNVSVDGTDRGRLAAKKRYQVEPGKRSLRCEQPGLGRAWSRSVTFASGEAKSLKATLLESFEVTISLSKGDRVRVAGKTYKSGARVTVKRGSRFVEVLDGSRVITKKLVKFVTSCTLRDSPRVSCAK